jgi:hypothetical protein
VKYVLMSYVKPGTWDALSDDERAAWIEDDAKFNAELAERGAVVSGEPLEDASTATTVRFVDGDPVLTDGPYAETAEQLGGVLVIEAEDLDDALDLAKRCPAARLGPLEVRPVKPHP